MAQRKATIKAGGFDPTKCRYSAKKLRANEQVMDYIRRVGHYETTDNIRQHIFRLTGWYVHENTIFLIQGGKNYRGVAPDKGVIDKRVLWDRILMLAKQGFNREQIIETLSISKNLMTRLERLHRHKIVSAKIKRSYFKAKE